VVLAGVVDVASLLQEAGKFDRVHSLVGVHRPLLQPRQTEEGAEKQEQGPQNERESLVPHGAPM